MSALRDEGPHLLEWVAHHKAIGVTDFLLFSNDCSDGTDKMLDLLEPAGVVHMPNVPPDGKSIQWNALKTAWGHELRKRADWILCIDTDEFINLRAPLADLPGLIEACPEADAIVLPWRLFGHNGQDRLTDSLTIETFTRAAPALCDYPVGTRQFKTLFRNKGPFRQIGVHRPRLKNDATARWVDGSGQPMPDSFAKAEQRLTLFGLPVATDLVQLNHYSVRSAESFMLKRERGLPNRRKKQIDLTYWVERNFNMEEDLSIHGMLPGTLAQFRQLMDIPDMVDLHRNAHKHHHAQFEQIMQDGAAVKLFGRLLLVASTAPMPNRLIAELVSRYQATHDG